MIAIYYIAGQTSSVEEKTMGRRADIHRAIGKGPGPGEIKPKKPWKKTRFGKQLLLCCNWGTGDPKKFRVSGQ